MGPLPACRRSSSTRTAPLGSREQALRLADKTMDIAERLGHLGAIFILLTDQVRERGSVGDLDAVDAVASKIIDVCERGGLPWLYVGHVYAGLAAHWRGDARTGRGGAPAGRRAGAAQRVRRAGSRSAGATPRARRARRRGLDAVRVGALDLSLR